LTVHPAIGKLQSQFNLKKGDALYVQFKIGHCLRYFYGRVSAQQLSQIF